ncbi:MAG: hypothetical protein V5B44_24080 [Candidatus Accumulibacter necessarius]|uniref:hypothetical protein n=1 Tax=Candidatus Accumulibacter necessarius TaxID=2954386 RepID=UPI002FC371F9
MRVLLPVPRDHERFSPSRLLLQSQFETLQRVSQVLARSLDFQQTLREVLRTLEISGHLSRGMVSVVDPDAGDLTVHAVHGLESDEFAAVRYRPGEGCSARSSKAAAAARSPASATSRAFSTGSASTTRDLPFIAVPIQVGGALQGVLAVQPDEPDDGLLEERLASSKCWPT